MLFSNPNSLLLDTLLNSFLFAYEEDLFKNVVKFDMLNQFSGLNSSIKAFMRQTSLIIQDVIHLSIYDKNYSTPNYINSHAYKWHAFMFKIESENVSKILRVKIFFETRKEDP